MSQQFFPPRPASRPTIYAYEDTHQQFAGLLKVGYTTQTAKARLDEIFPAGSKAAKIPKSEMAC
jgi:hypothetical protein